MPRSTTQRHPREVPTRIITLQNILQADIVEALYWTVTVRPPIHAMRRAFNENEIEVSLLVVDATNTFSSLNRQIALHNIHIAPLHACHLHKSCSTYTKPLFTVCFQVVGKFPPSWIQCKEILCHGDLHP